MLAQLTVDLTPLAPAHVMVLFVSLGAVLSGIGLYEPLVQLAGAGATVPLTGFGHALLQGGLEEMQKEGLMGVIGGGLKATSLGIATAILSGYLMAVLFRPKV